ncbi:hypothetical protein GF359_00545 [candidate division WOR-3 bacterium]|uniref:Zinc-finger domain-containing protein n=1 Tax=candidate division WOR-3 bacterium TaxID=2052148 RepID=A0A9D5K953_UNCW3|nr:hypothetical protein [candidate division WOR-3 bacterium]MBD3363681.1 hypothetical protein [candidate division WOR-3 bacterium]
MKDNTSAIVMDCAESRKWIELRFDGEEIPEAITKKLDKHLASCDGCRSWAARMETALAKLETLAEPQPTGRFKARLMRELGLSPVPVWLRWAGGVAAGFFAAWLLAVTFLGDRLLGAAREGIPVLSRLLRIGQYLLPAGSGQNSILTIATEIGIIILGGAILLIALGILARRMVTRAQRTHPAAARSA